VNVVLIMSSFSPPPFSSSPPQMGGFSPPPMDNFGPPPMSSFSPPPINGFSPPPLDDSDDVIGDHFGLRRHSDMSDDNSFDLTGFSEKMKKIEIEKMKHLPPREILEIQRESLGEKGDIFVSLNGLEVETEQKHKRLFINNETPSFPSANNKLNIDFDETGVENLCQEDDEPVNIYEDRTEFINENKRLHHLQIEDTRSLHHPEIEDTKSLHHPEIDDAKSLHLPEIEDAKGLHHPESEDAESLHHPESENTKSVHHPASEDTESLHLPETEDAESLHHPESEDTKHVHHLKSDDTKSLRHLKSEDTKSVHPSESEDTKSVNHHESEDTKSVHHPECEDTRTGHHPEIKDALGDLSEPEFGDFSEHQTWSEPAQFEFCENKTGDVGDKLERQVDDKGDIMLERSTERDDFVEHFESGNEEAYDSDITNVLDDKTITSKVTIDGQLMNTNTEDPECHHIVSQLPGGETLEAELEKPVAFDDDAGDNQNVSENGDEFDAFGAFSEESCSVLDNVKDSSGFQTNWRNFESEESRSWVEAPNVTNPPQETMSTGIEFDSDDDDDDFGDFGDADNSFGELSQSVPGPATYTSQIEEFDDLVRKLLPKVSTVIINMYETVIVEADLDDDNELVDDEGGDNLVQSVLDDPVIWTRVEDPSTAPALDYTWLQSNTYTTLLNTLNIDTRNVLDGEGWKNSVPKFAANLMTPGLLQPLSAEQGPTENAKQNHKHKELVQPAEFDWNNSGLVNPLETDGQRSKAVAPSTDPISAISQSTSQRSQATPTQTTHLPSSTPNTPSASSAPSQDRMSMEVQGSAPSQERMSMEVQGSAPSQESLSMEVQGSAPSQERMSREAAAMLDSFPLLSFMSSSMLTFPVKSVERKGKRKT